MEQVVEVIEQVEETIIELDDVQLEMVGGGCAVVFN